MTALAIVIFNQSKRAATFSLSALLMRGEDRGKVGSFHKLCGFLLACFLSFAVPSRASENFPVLKPAAFAQHVARFNSFDAETIPTTISNQKSWAWLQDNIPLFECPDHDVEEIYYFRWWSFRKHIKQTAEGYVITEFLPPVSHAGEFNTISCATGFHLAEGRWLRDDRYLNDYTKFWLRGDHGKPAEKFHNFSSWFAAAAWDRFLVNGDRKFLVALLPDLVADYRAWETERQLPFNSVAADVSPLHSPNSIASSYGGLFWQYDVRDGMEESISGSRIAKNIRPTINSYMFANAQAIASLARVAGKPKLANEFAAKASMLRQLTLDNLWDDQAKFFKVRLESGALSDAREAIGFIPWMFELPGTNKAFELAWSQFTDPQGFAAPFGITTAERRHPEFRSHGNGTCEWDGAVWPFATSQTLYGLANYLRSQANLSNPSHLPPHTSFFDAFLTYTRSQHSDGKPFIGEYLDEVTGDWINGKNDRSRYYNHSTYADLLITGVIGFVPRADAIVEISPLLPTNTWDWFCLDGVKYHGHMLTVLWDKDGSRYGRGAGLCVLADGKEIGRSESLTQLKCRLQ